MTKVAVYLFRSQECMDYGFTSTAHYFTSMEKAAAFAADHRFAKVTVLGAA